MACLLHFYARMFLSSANVNSRRIGRLFLVSCILVLFSSLQVFATNQREVGISHCVQALHQMAWLWNIPSVPDLDELMKKKGALLSGLTSGISKNEFRSGRDSNPLSFEDIIYSLQSDSPLDERLSSESIDLQISNLLAGTSGDEVFIDGEVTVDLLIDFYKALKIFKDGAKLHSLNLANVNNWKRHLSTPDVYSSWDKYEVAKKRFESMPPSLKVLRATGKLGSNNQDFLEYIYGEQGYRIQMQIKLDDGNELQLDFYSALTPLAYVLDHPFDFQVNVFAPQGEVVRSMHFNGPLTNPIIKDFLILSESLKNFILDGSQKNQN